MVFASSFLDCHYHTVELLLYYICAFCIFAPYELYMHSIMSPDNLIIVSVCISVFWHPHSIVAMGNLLLHVTMPIFYQCNVMVLNIIAL